jgi:hypothetical protein
MSTTRCAAAGASLILAFAAAAYAQIRSPDLGAGARPAAVETLDLSRVVTRSLDLTTVEYGPIHCFGGDMITTDTTWMRAFDLDGDHGISGAFRVNGLDRGVQESAGNPDVTFAVPCAPLEGSTLSTPLAITQNLEPDTLVDGTSVADFAGDYTTDNRYLRLYDLDGEFGIAGPFCVTSVDYGCQSAVGGPGGTQPVTLHTYCLDDGSPFLSEFLELQDEVITTVPDCHLQFFNTEIGGCCDSRTQSLVVEIHAEDCLASGTCLNFWIGMNDLGQTAPTYLICPG